MRADLNIHGVKVRLSADPPFIFKTLLEDLAAFRSSPSNDRETLHLKISALAPFLRDGETDRETAMQSAGKKKPAKKEAALQRSDATGNTS